MSISNRTHLWAVLAAIALLGGIGGNDAAAQAPAEANKKVSPLLKPWRGKVTVAPVSSDAERHSIHSYFNTCPESPDGRWVLYFSSAALDGHEGELRIHERATGKEKVLAKGITTEDAHRAACQQWISGGRRVVFHDVRDGQWVVVSVDIETLQERVLATGRQLSWGQPLSDLVPLYGPHWDPAAFHDLELLDVNTGERRTVLTAAAVQAAYGDWIAKEFDGQPISIFFPILSPDLQRVIFKLASPRGGDFRSKQASHREGLIGYDLKQAKFLFQRPSWGHPAWHGDSRQIINVGIVIDSDTGASSRIAELPHFRGSHPSFSPDGKLFATDTLLEAFGGTEQEWGVVVADVRGGDYQFLHRFDNSKGARSWRRSHPHPIFSADGNRVYFNVSDSKFTQLYVAQQAD